MQNKISIIYSLLLLTILSLSEYSFSQTVGIGTATPHASAMLDVQSTSKGLLIPRMSDVQMRSIPSPEKSLMVFNLTDSSLYLKRDSGWIKISNGNADNFWNYKNGHIYNFNSGNVGIGVDTPVHAGLEIANTVGAAAAMFGVGKYGVTIEADNPEIGFNYFYNGSPRTIKAGNAAMIGMYPSGFYKGTIYIGNFGDSVSNTDYGTINGSDESFRLSMLIATDGDISMGRQPNGSLLIPAAALTVGRSNPATTPWGTAAFFGTDLASHFSYSNEEDTYIRGGKYKYSSLISGSRPSDVYINDYSGLDTATSTFTKGGNVLIAGGGGNVGIGTNGPVARLHVADSMVLFSGSFLVSPFSLPPLVASNNLLWIPQRAAFRAGYSDNTHWNINLIGLNSTAFGYNVVASGQFSLANGYNSTALGLGSASIGYNTFANESFSVALGHSTLANSTSSFAIGDSTIANNNYATAIGRKTYASGIASLASGDSTTASGTNSFATGNYSKATNLNSVALGYKTIASGIKSFSTGDSCIAGGTSSMALGSRSIASGNYSTAIGTSTTASNDYSTAIGTNTTASGYYSTAFGLLTTASGMLSTTMGYKMNANLQKGAFGIGDSDPNLEGETTNGIPDQFVARFWNGYYLITSGNIVRTGVVCGHGQNSWSAVSDVRMKENFLPVEGESFLNKISKLNLTTWNYKGQDVKTFRHYGPMAQDFYAAFGKDKLGTIGCDTLINQQDFLGINLIAIQALEKRTRKIGELQKENEELKKEVALIRKQLEELMELIRK